MQRDTVLITWGQLRTCESLEKRMAIAIPS